MHGVDSNVFHSYQYSALALGPLLSTHLLKLFRVISKCGFVLVARIGLQLVGVLQLFDPLGFLHFETADLSFNLLSAVVLLVNPVDQVLPLLLALEHLLLLSAINAFLLLTPNHLFHGSIFKLLGLLLHRHHLLVLHLLLFKTVSFMRGTESDSLLVILDVTLLLTTTGVECLTLHLFLTPLEVFIVILFSGFDLVALTDF